MGFRNQGLGGGGGGLRDFRASGGRAIRCFCFFFEGFRV